MARGYRRGVLVVARDKMWCPRCRVGPREVCRTRGGKPTDLHKGRIRLAERSLYGVWPGAAVEGKDEDAGS